MNTFVVLFACLHAAFAQDIGNGVVCAQDVKCCKHDKTKCVGRNPEDECRFLPCRTDAEKPTWARPEGNKTRIRDKFQTLLDTVGVPPFRDVFIDDAEYSDLTKTERKDAKKYLYRQYRGFPIKIQKTDETVLDYDQGGIKLFKKFKNPDRDFFLIDDPEFENDGVDISADEAFTFEDAAEFKRRDKNYSCTTERKTAAEGHHKTVFTDKDTGESCSVDGKTATGCKVGSTRFDVLFSGSAGAIGTDVDCLSQTDVNELDRPEGAPVFILNNETYDRDTYIGLNIGTYVITPVGDHLEDKDHPFKIDDLTINGTVAIRVLNCTELGIGDGCVGTYTFELL